jgi:L-lactate dehydrogenase
MAKIGIIGAGSVGATIAYAAMIRGVARHISLFDIARSKVNAEVLDLNHGMLFTQQVTLDGSDDVEVLRDANVVVMTAGPSRSRDRHGWT